MVFVALPRSPPRPLSPGGSGEGTEGTRGCGQRGHGAVVINAAELPRAPENNSALQTLFTAGSERADAAPALWMAANSPALCASGGTGHVRIASIPLWPWFCEDTVTSKGCCLAFQPLRGFLSLGQGLGITTIADCDAASPWDV